MEQPFLKKDAKKIEYLAHDKGVFMAISPELYNDVKYCQLCGEPMSVITDREGKTRSRCTACGWIKYLNPIPAAACLIVNDEGKIVVIKRKYEPNPGEWALPSGYIELDQTAEEAAIAEMQEETGLDGEIVQFIDYYMGYSPIYYRVLSMGFQMRIAGGELQAGDDASEARYVSLDELPPICFDSHRHFIKKYQEQLEKSGDSLK